MPKSSSIYTRVEPELKEKAENVLSRLGIPVANAINIFLHQVVLQNGIPFDVKLTKSLPLDYSTLTAEQFNAEIEKGMTSLKNGKITSAAQVRENMQRQYIV